MTPPVDVLWPNFAKRGGLCVVIAQDCQSRDILMQGYVDEAGFTETLQTGEAVYFSTSRKVRWKKGESSGDIQVVRDILLDCDGDAIIYLVEQRGAGACHTKARSCFYRDIRANYLAPVTDGPAERLPTRPIPLHPNFQPSAAHRSSTATSAA